MKRSLGTLLAIGTVFLSCTSSGEKLNSGIEQANFDKSVRPQDDLYRHVNGQWLNTFDIPADKSNYGSFTKLAESAKVNLRAIIEEAAKSKASEGTEAQKIGDLYATYLDSTTTDQLGISPLQAELDRISSMKSTQEIPALIVRMLKIGANTPFFFWVGQDGKKSDEYISNVYQSGISLPDKSYYEGKDEKFITIREKFVAHIAKILTMSKIAEPTKKANRILEIETEIASHHWTRTENRNRDKTYNKYTVADLKKEMNGFNWTSFFQEAGISDAQELIVFQPSFFTGINKMFASVSLNDWKTYFQWRLITSFAGSAGSAFFEENFDFFSRTLSGVEEPSPRWKRAVDMINGNLGQMVGKLYVEKHFKPEAKARMNVLIDNLVKAFEQRINGLEWMSAETKVKALEKLKKFDRKIGYPDVWKDYSSLKIVKGELIANTMRANEWGFYDNINKLGKPIDRTEWGMTPQTVNAYYSPSKNEIVFPAAILQPPFFNMDADDAVNYGGIGAVIGHELSHGFDDQGSKSDGDGNLKNWWTDMDLENFQTRGNQLVAQYDTYNPIDTMHVNGRFTLGENIGDLGGLTVAYYAYKNALNGKKSPQIDGHTGEQRFFMGWAQVWARKYRAEELQRRLLTDTHSPSEYRCNGIITNMPEFYEAFGVKEGDKLYKSPENQIKIW